MSLIVVEVEADGPILAEFSMVCFGAVLFDEALDKSFYGQPRPISNRFVPEALAVSGFSREQHLTFDDPKMVMETFAAWLEEHSKGRPVFVSDNVAFDWQFINYYFHRFLGGNSFGFSGRRIGDLYAGLVKAAQASHAEATHESSKAESKSGWCDREVSYCFGIVSISANVSTHPDI
jgi:hypothetical protein